jgi:6-phospho-beta-glucosidase
MKARKLKINLIGYSLWTYCDIFSPSGGYRKDYGLVSVNFKNKNKTRRPKLSYIWYRKAIQTNGLDLSTNWKKMTQELKTEIKDWQKHKLINNKTS